VVILAAIEGTTLYYIYLFIKLVGHRITYELQSEQGFRGIAEARAFMEAQGWDTRKYISFLQQGEPAPTLQMEV
jgi:hypothetical protein